MNVRERMRERGKAREWFRTLSRHDIGELGDALVLGYFDWREWGFERKPSGVFMREVDDLRINAEIMEDG